MQIKKIKKENLKEIYEISYTQFAKESWTMEQFQEIFNNNNYLTFAVFEGIKLCSYCIVLESADDFNILSIATDKNNLNKGFATKLIEHLIKLGNDCNKTISLEVKSKNINAINLYKKLNFKQVYIRKKYYKDGDDALIMFYEKVNK